MTPNPAYSLVGRIESNGTAMTLTGTGVINNPQLQLTLDATIPSAANLTFGLASATSNINGGTGRTLNLLGTLKATNAGTLFIANTLAVAGGASGTLEVAPTTGNISVSHGGAFTIKNVNAIMSATRTVTVNGGGGTHTFTDVSISGAGTGSVTLGTTTGTTNLNYTNLNLGTLPARSVTINSTAGTGNITGILSGQATITRRIANVAATLTNPTGATIAPGNSPGTIAIAGAITNLGDLTMELESASSFDKITATGAATLTSGNVNVTLIGGYDPAPGTAFTIFDAASLTGTFSAINLPSLGSGKFWLSPVYDAAAGTVVIQVSTVVLPIELSSFTATKANNKTAIAWATASESNNDYFSVERSTNGVNFEAIGREKGAGTSTKTNNYAFTDEKPLSGVNYYRLKQTDFDGRFTYSKVVSVNHGSKNTIFITPKATQSALNIATDLDEYAVAIYNTAGQEVKRIGNLSLNQTVEINDLNEGIYFVKIQGENGFVETQKITKF
jgi:hypothetical protein